MNIRASFRNRSALLAGALNIAATTGCAGQVTEQNGEQMTGAQYVQDDGVRGALEAALVDEYKARATYTQVLAEFGDVRPFSNIVQAEDRHAKAIEALLQTRGLPIPDDPWVGPDAGLPHFGSLKDACTASATAERENIALYDNLMRVQALPDDVREVFVRLQDASRSRHLPAFERCAAMRS